jgi:gliding motility-associated-like protein
MVNWYPNAGLGLLLASGDTYTPTANQNQTYWVNQTAQGCTSDSIPVTIEFSVVQLPVGDTLVSYCEGEPVPVLSVSGSNIQWYNSAQLATPIGSGTSLNPPEAAGTYWVTSTEGSCVSEALVVDLVLNDLVSAEITSLNGTSLCSGEPIMLESADATLNSWSNGETAQSISIEEAGTYILTREGECNTATDQIVITGLPVFADFTTSADSGYTVFDVQVTDISINAETCIWTLNDSVITLLSSGTLTFADSGTYNLQVICTNSSGCADTASRVIKVLSDQLGLIVPNVFTPGNGDGLNNLFQVKHNAVKTFSARVYNRWGKMLYSWEDKNSGWDGTSNGEKQSDGTYFYIINGTDVKDQPFEERGTVTLLGN